VVGKSIELHINETSDIWFQKKLEALLLHIKLEKFLTNQLALSDLSYKYQL
jgi:hypothetical protein